MKNRIVFQSKSLTDTDLYGVEYQLCINSDKDIQVGDTASAQLVFTIDKNVYTPIKGEWLLYYNQQWTSSEKLYGTFLVTEVVENRNKYKVTAYDFMTKFDKSINDFWTSVSTTETVYSLTEKLCTYVGVSLFNISFTNSTKSVTKTVIQQNNISCRQFLSYIAQLSGGYAWMRPNGNLELRKFSNTAVSVNNRDYIEANISEFKVNKIDKVWVGTTEDDVGVVAGSGTNVLKILDNPLFYTDTPSSIQTYVTNIYNAVKDYEYYPTKIRMFEDHGLVPGNRYSVNGVNTYVFSIVMSNKGVTTESTGNKERPSQPIYIDMETKRLRGAYNTLSRDLEQTKSEVGTIDGRVTTVEQTASGLTTRVSTAEGNITTLITRADGLDVTVAGKVGNNEVISKINASAESVSINASKVNLTGYLTITAGDSRYDSTGAATTAVNNLKTDLSSSSGTTVINGAHITTGTLDASKITTGTMSADRINGGTIDGSSISLGSGQFTVDTSGNVVAKSITANNSGSVGGWTIGSSTLSKNNMTIDSANSTIKVGTSGAMAYLNQYGLLFNTTSVSAGANRSYYTNGTMAIYGTTDSSSSFTAGAGHWTCSRNSTTSVVCDNLELPNSWTPVSSYVNKIGIYSNNDAWGIGRRGQVTSSQYALRGGFRFYGATSTAVVGTLYSETGTAITSDENVKMNIGQMPESYNRLFDNINPVRFKYKNGTSDRYHTGFISQQVGQAIDEAGLTSQDFAGYVRETDSEGNESYYLRYEEFIALNMQQIKMLKEEVAALKEKIKELE